MTVRIVGNDVGGFKIVDAKDNSQVLGFAPNYALASLIVSNRGWTLVR